MEVYLIPVGTNRYELYCEVPENDADDPPEADRNGDAGPARGLFKILRRKFRLALTTAERERRHTAAAQPRHHPERRRWTRRLRDIAMRWLAEKIAEQRLLWHLRRQDQVAALFPEDLSEEAAMAAVRRMLQRDAERHRFWLAIDTMGFLVSGLLVLVPGPNVIAYYFAFRVVGHFLSLRGARQGLNHVTWKPQPSAPLAELRQAIALAPAQRERRVSDIASRLHLPHLPGFFSRTAIPSA